MDAEAVAVATTRRGSAPPSGAPASQLLTVTMGPDNGTGYAEQVAVDATAIDAHAIGREAAERARASANPVDIEPGDYPVVLHHYAVVDLVDMLGYLGFSALAVQEDRSFWEAGRKVASPLVSLARRRVRSRRACRSAFDAEGVPKQRLSAARRGRVPRPRVRRLDRGQGRAAPRPATGSRHRTRTARSPPTW